MKRGLVTFMLMAIIIPNAYAAIVLEGPSKDKYNLGDEMFISGYVSRNADFEGLFTLEFLCDGRSFQLPITSLILGVGQRKNFPADLQIPKIIVPNALSGSCFIKAALVEDGISETATSKNFEITKELKGDFEIDETRVQLGKSFSLKGDVYKMNGDRVDGSGELYFEGNNSSFLVDIFGIKVGDFSYVYESKSIPDGEYEIDLFVNDINGNQQLFENIAHFTLVKELYVFAKVDESTLNPGDSIKVFGNVKTILQENVNEGTVTIGLDDQKFITNMDQGEYEKEFKLKENTKAGKHFITVSVEDYFGNKGRSEISIVVNQKPASLVLKLSNGTLNPGNTLRIIPALYDQAGDIVKSAINIEIRDPSSNLIFSDAADTNENVLLLIDKFAKPGIYKVEAKSANLAETASFVLNELSALDVVLLDQDLFVENTGNVMYKKPMRMDLNDGFYTVTKRVSLEPGENLTVMLNQEFPSGQYNLKIVYDGNEKEFGDVIIMGKEAVSLNVPYTILSFMGVILLAVLSVYGGKFKRAGYKRISREREMARKSRERIMAMKKPNKISMDKEDEVADFRERILREIKDTERKSKEMAESKKGSYYREREDDKKGKGLFGMFD